MFKIAKYLMLSLLIISSNNSLFADSNNNWNYTKLAIGAVGGAASLLCFWKSYSHHQAKKELKAKKLKENVREQMRSDFAAINQGIRDAEETLDHATINADVSTFAQKPENQNYLNSSKEFQEFKGLWDAYPKSLRAITQMKAASAHDTRPKSMPADREQYRTMTSFERVITPLRTSSNVFLQSVKNYPQTHKEKVDSHKFLSRRWGLAGTLGVAGTAAALWFVK